MRNVDFIETGFTVRSNFIFVRYLVTKCNLASQSNISASVLRKCAMSGGKVSPVATCVGFVWAPLQCRCHTGSHTQFYGHPVAPLPGDNHRSDTDFKRRVYGEEMWLLRPVQPDFLNKN
jgi:hypothetical protein